MANVIMDEKQMKASSAWLTFENSQQLLAKVRETSLALVK